MRSSHYCVGVCGLQGLDLREYAKTIEKELVQVERASVDDCTSRFVCPVFAAACRLTTSWGGDADINQSPQLEALHSQIQVCGATSAPAQSMHRVCTC
jgi:hypothetical protein